MELKGSFFRKVKGHMLNHMHSMITCKEFEDFVQRYLDDELTGREKTLFEWHMRICRECREYLASYQRTIEIGHAVFDSKNAQLSTDVPEDLIKAILESRNK